MSSRKPIDHVDIDALDGQVLQFNERHEVGTFVRYWPARSDVGNLERSHVITWTTCTAWLLQGHTAVVGIFGRADCVSINHIVEVDDPDENEAGVCLAIITRARSITDPNDQLDILFNQCGRVQRYLEAQTKEG